MNNVHMHSDQRSSVCTENTCDLMNAERARTRYSHRVAWIAASISTTVVSTLTIISAEPIGTVLASLVAAAFGALFFVQFCGRGDRSLED